MMLAGSAPCQHSEANPGPDETCILVLRLAEIL